MLYSKFSPTPTHKNSNNQHQANDYKSGFIYEFNLKKEWWESIEVKPESADEEELRVNFPLELLLKLNTLYNILFQALVEQIQQKHQHPALKHLKDMLLEHQ